MENLLKTICNRILDEEGHLFDLFDPDEFNPAKRRPPRPVPAGPGSEFLFICEIKRASPVKGRLCANFEPGKLARQYERAGAGAISVITEKNFFRGSVEHLLPVRRQTNLPLLRKDFLIHPQQVYSSYNLGADFILLIAACLGDDQLKEMVAAARLLNLSVMIEIHPASELERVLSVNPDLLAINNRNLDDFSVDSRHSLAIKPLVPEEIPVISASGINSAAQIRELKAAGFAGALIGEHLVRSSEPEKTLRRLIHD